MNFTYENTCYFESVYNDTRKDIRIEKAAILSKRAQTVFQAASVILFLAAVFLLRADRRKFEVVVSTFLSSLVAFTDPSDACSRTAGISKNVLVKRLRGNALRVTRKIAPLANQTLFGPTPYSSTRETDISSSSSPRVVPFF